MNASVLELERRLGFRLPVDYREFLVSHRERLLDGARLFMPPRSGVIDLILTADEILRNDDQKKIGIPDKSLLHIGGNLMGGYLYLKVSEDAFGQIHYMESYEFREQFPSFSAFLNETQSEATMLATHITEGLRSAFPEVAFVYSCPPDPVATLGGPCAELSPLQICDDGDEATIYLGKITHGHLGCYEEGISEDERNRRIAGDVVDFVRDLLSDRIVASSSLGGAVGGWRRLAPDDALPGASMLRNQYVWSRSLQ